MHTTTTGIANVPCLSGRSTTARASGESPPATTRWSAESFDVLAHNASTAMAQVKGRVVIDAGCAADGELSRLRSGAAADMTKSWGGVRGSRPASVPEGMGVLPCAK